MVHFYYRSYFTVLFSPCIHFPQLTHFYLLQPIWKLSTGTLVSQYINLCSSTGINIPSTGIEFSSKRAQRSSIQVKIFSKGLIYILPVQNLFSSGGTTLWQRKHVTIQERELGMGRKILRKTGIMISQIILPSYNHTKEDLKQLFYRFRLFMMN